MLLPYTETEDSLLFFFFPQKQRSRMSTTKNVSFLKSREYFGLVVVVHNYRHEFLCHILSHKGPIHSQLNWAILPCDVMPDGKPEWTAQFWQALAQASELSLLSVHSFSNSLHNLQHPFLAIQSADEHRISHDIFLFKHHFLLHILRFLFFFSDNIMADVTSKQQTTALFLSTIVTRTRRHTELTKKTEQTVGKPVLCQKTFSSVFRASFLYS